MFASPSIFHMKFLVSPRPSQPMYIRKLVGSEVFFHDLDWSELPSVFIWPDSWRPDSPSNRQTDLWAAQIKLRWNPSQHLSDSSKSRAFTCSFNTLRYLTFALPPKRNRLQTHLLLPQPCFLSVQIVMNTSSGYFFGPSFSFPIFFQAFNKKEIIDREDGHSASPSGFHFH